jgi:hypothetical protein
VQVLLLARVLQQPVRQEPFLRLQVRLFQEQGLVREHQPERPVQQVVLLPALAQGLQLLGLGLLLPGPVLLRQQVPEPLFLVPGSLLREQTLGLVQELQQEQVLELLVWQGLPLEQTQRTFPEGLWRRYP